MSGRLAGRALLVAIALGLGLFAFFPLATVLGAALEGSASPLRAELGDPGAQQAWLNTLRVAALVTACALPLGAALAWLLERTDVLGSERRRARWSAILTLPLAVPPYLLAMAWALLGNGRSGLLNRLAGAPVLDLYGLDGITLTLTLASYPFVFLAVRAALARADASLEEAARVSGASPLTVLGRVTLPLLAPTLAASAGLVFVFASAAFGVPYLLGAVAEPPVEVLTTRIFRLTALGGTTTMGRAAALALFLLATSAAAQLLLGRLVKARSVVQVTGKASRPARLALGALRRPLELALFVFAAVFLVLPLASIAWTSLLESFADPLGIGLMHWRAVLSRSETAQAFLHSGVLAVSAGALVALLGLAIARLAERRGRWGELLVGAAALPYAVPGTVLAIGLSFAFSRELRLVLLERLTIAFYLPGTLALLLVAYVVKELAFGVRGARAALEQLHPSLEEAARISGAGPARATREVVLPLVSPALAAAFVVVALPSLSELTMSVLLFGPRTATAGTLLFELDSYASPPAGCVVATLLVAVAILQHLVLQRIERRQETRT
jgi:iron(III) transport system permease protein